MLSERTMNDNRLQNNLSNEVTSLHERVQSLEKEKLDLVDKYSRYGEEFKSLLSKE
jgi:FtsZ-binding cell division protein ZapB